MNFSATTVDGVLNHRVKLEQPVSGYRIAIDTVLLAAAVPALPGDQVLDMGCGVGGALLCLGCRTDHLSGHGIEIQKDLVQICHRNFERNVFGKGFTVAQGDVTSAAVLNESRYDHVFMNPPYYEEESHDVSSNLIKQTANAQPANALAPWFGAARHSLKPSGTLTLIHRGEREEEIVSLLETSFGEVEVLRLLAKKGGSPKRVVIRARKNALGSVHVFQPIVLHQEGDGFSEEIEKVLRQAEPLVFQSP